MPEFYYRLHFPIFLWRHFSRCSAQPTHFVNQFSPLFFPFLPPNPCVCIVHWPFKYNSWGGQLRWQLGWSWTWSWWRSRLVWVTLDRVSGGSEYCFGGNEPMFSVILAYCLQNNLKITEIAKAWMFANINIHLFVVVSPCLHTCLHVCTRK